MAEFQPESAAAIQAFLLWKFEPGIRRTGCRGSDNIVSSYYISQADLRDYLTTERIRSLLWELFENTNQSHPQPEGIRSNYLRPFAILLSIGYGRMIRHFVEHLKLRDRFLPFYSEPEDFPKASTQNLFEAFRREQWQFCTVALKYDMRDDLADDYILPITAKEKISGGGSAILYKITVDEVYNKLKPANDAHTTARSRNPNTFVLKTYRTPDAKKYFETERNAFEKLRYGERPPENIIEYYGSFIRPGTYNIILEYADRGTLDDYMKNSAEPKSVTEIRSFWDNFLASMRGLVQIHSTHKPASDGPNILLGWHHDIDPSNILVVSKGKGSPYDCDFKIADLGLAHFKRYISPLYKATDNDRYGMSTYGAPETFRSTDLEKFHLLVLQSADIWSMGCVYSEVATWVTEGSAKLHEYRRRRQKEIAQKLGVSSTEEDCFHHGSKILETVDEIHDEIKRNSRRCDLITPYVIERLVKGMVRPQPPSRGSAQFLLETSSEILKDAKRKREEATPSGSAPNPDRPISDPGIDGRRRRHPPRLPPEQRFATETQPVKTRFSSHDLEQGTILQRPLMTYGQANSHNWQQRSVPKPNEEGSRPRSQRNREEGPINNLEAHFEELGISPTPQPSPPHTDSHCGPRSLNPGPAWVPFQPRENIVMPTEEVSSQSREQPRVLEDIHSDRPVRSQTATSWTQTYAPNGHPESRLASVPKPNPTSQHPTMTVSEGLRIIREKKLKFVKYPDEDEILKKRDHVFLIDNGESMQPHWEKVEEVSELLATLTQPYDPDGLELYFSRESGKLRPKNPQKFMKYVKERPAHGRPDFRQRFAKIIEDYQSRLVKSNYMARLRHPISTPSKGPRPLSLYVLTDGVWDPKCTLITEVKHLVALLKEHNSPKKYVGVQFIRFGNDREGKKRLNTLDARLGLELDVVDTTSANGNVWKMLLGAVNNWYDDDIDSDDDDEDDVHIVQPSTKTRFSSPNGEQVAVLLKPSTTYEQINNSNQQRRSILKPNEEGFPRLSQGVRKGSPIDDLAAQDEGLWFPPTVNNLGLLYSASISASSIKSDSSETESIASFAGSDSSKSSVSSGASDALAAGLDETTEFFLSDEELRDLFAKAFTSQSRDKVLRNGVRLLKWLGRRLVISAKTTIEKEAADFFLSQSHGKSIMTRIASQIVDNPIVPRKQGHTAQHQLQSSMKREKVERQLQQLREAPSVNVGPREQSTLKTITSTPNDFESENSTDSEDEQQIAEEEKKLNLDAAKSFLKSSDALARLKEELGDFISPFSGEAMWKKTLWIGGQQVHFELPETAPQRTRINGLKLALKEHLKMPILWWPLKQPRKSLSSNRVRMILPCACGFETYVDVSYTKARRYRQMCDTYPTRSKPGQQPILPTTNVSLNSWSAVGQGETSASVSKGQPVGNLQLRPTMNRSARPESQGLELKSSQMHTAPEYIHWCVNTAPQRTLLYEVCKEKMKGKDFINELCRSYRKIRGWRWYFSMTTCAEIRFVNHTSIHPKKKKVVKCGCGKKKVLPELHERHEYTYRPYPEMLDEDDRICLAEQALIHYYHGYETCFDTDHFSKLVDSIPCRFNGAELGYKGYGIWARQGWTLPKLAAFVLITQGWSMVFVVIWLWFHPGDLQNAFVPALYWLAFITIFVMVPDVFRT